jgi:deoxyxylulose-5-phosphate synthase
MKVLVSVRPPIGKALEAIISAVGSEIVSSVKDADEVILMSTSDAVDHLLEGRSVAILTMGSQDVDAVEALLRNRKFAKMVTIFNLRFTEDSDETMMGELFEHYGNGGEDE